MGRLKVSSRSAGQRVADSRCTQTQMMAAARAHDAPLVLSMLERHPGLANFHDHNGQTPLLAAVDDALLPYDAPRQEDLDGQRHIDTVTALCEYDALANVADTSTRFTPLCLASVKGFIRVIEVLLSLGADISLRISSDHPTFGGWTALHFAAYAGHGGVCAGLVYMGADGTARTSALPRGSVPLAHTAHMPGLHPPQRPVPFPGGYTPLLVAATSDNASVDAFILLLGKCCRLCGKTSRNLEKERLVRTLDGTEETGPFSLFKKLRHCSTCKAQYCSRQCQVKDLKDHSPICRGY
jgi:hypothetical protein